jgi:2,3-dihydroxybiphenyl 1,2-dioxygenase
MTTVTQLGYLDFEVSDVQAWEAFATGILGLGVASRNDGGALSLRMDRYQHRFFLHPGPADDLAAIGWQVDGDQALDAIAGKLQAAGVATREGTPEEVLQRGVRRLVHYVDPAGIPSELFYGLQTPAEPFRSPIVQSGFVADELGLGHAVLAARSQKESVDFYCHFLGFRLSDYVVTEVYGFKVDIAFLHANSRHHSVAFSALEQKRMHHFMLQVQSVDDVGLACDRALAKGARIMNTLGRHPNDRMLSFYAKTPSGFQVEYGWGAREIDDMTWQPTTYSRISEWGHHPPEAFIPARRPR